MLWSLYGSCQHESSYSGNRQTDRETHTHTHTHTLILLCMYRGLINQTTTMEMLSTQKGILKRNMKGIESKMQLAVRSAT